jgi:hypothetical protein
VGLEEFKSLGGGFLFVIHQLTLKIFQSVLAKVGVNEKIIFIIGLIL